MSSRPPRICIVSPALAAANNGNWQTAARWQRFLAPVADVSIAATWDGSPVDALIALHARRSADSIARFHAAHAASGARGDSTPAPIAVVLTGTDLYRDLATDLDAQHSLDCASQLVVLQDEGIAWLPLAARAKARCIVQSAPTLARRSGVVSSPDDASDGKVTFVAVGHLRDEKDPLTLMRAARLLATQTAIHIQHIGAALDMALGAAAQQTARACAHYEWLGELPHAPARRAIARADALVHMSRMEGGANVVIEALRCGVPVLASRIDGNVGLLGRDYGGYFEVGDAPALATLLQRFASDAALRTALRAQCALRAPLFAPAVERAAVRRLLKDLQSDSRTRADNPPNRSKSSTDSTRGPQ